MVMEMVLLTTPCEQTIPEEAGWTGLTGTIEAGDGMEESNVQTGTTGAGDGMEESNDLNGRTDLDGLTELHVQTAPEGRKEPNAPIEPKDLIGLADLKELNALIDPEKADGVNSKTSPFSKGENEFLSSHLFV
jgi:hypothetical protein